MIELKIIITIWRHYTIQEISPLWTLGSEVKYYFVDFFARPPVRCRPVVFFVPPVRLMYAFPSWKEDDRNINGIFTNCNDTYTSCLTHRSKSFETCFTSTGWFGYLLKNFLRINRCLSTFSICTCITENFFSKQGFSFLKIVHPIDSFNNSFFEHTFAVVFIVRALDNFGLALLLLELVEEDAVAALLVDTVGVSSSLLDVDDSSRASR